jgi:hypothetical protein
MYSYGAPPPHQIRNPSRTPPAMKGYLRWRKGFGLAVLLTNTGLPGGISSCDSNKHIECLCPYETPYPNTVYFLSSVVTVSGVIPAVTKQIITCQRQAEVSSLARRVRLVCLG